MPSAMMKARYKKNAQGMNFACPFSIISSRANSFGNPPKIQLIGRIIMQEPAREVDITITSSEYLKVSSPKGMVKTTSKMTKDHTEYMLKTLQKIELTIVATMNPKTTQKQNLHAPMKKIDTLTKRVSPYAIKVDRNMISRSEKQMASVLESGRRIAVNMPVSTAKLRKQAVMNIIRWVISTPKKSITKPTMNSNIPKMSKFSVRAFQMLLSWKTGQAQGVDPQMTILFICSSALTCFKEMSSDSQHQRKKSVDLAILALFGLFIDKFSLISPLSLIYCGVKQLVFESELYASHECTPSLLLLTTKEQAFSWMVLEHS